MTIHVSKEEHDAVAAYVEGTLAPLINMLLVKQLSMAAVFLREEIAKTNAAAPLLTHKAEDAPSDGELLDWLEAHLFERKWSGTIGQPSGWYMAGPYRHTMQHMRGESLRAAIRAAIAQERKA